MMMNKTPYHSPIYTSMMLGTIPIPIILSTTTLSTVLSDTCTNADRETTPITATLAMLMCETLLLRMIGKRSSDTISLKSTASTHQGIIIGP